MTIVGKHTVDEANKLAAVVDYRMRETFKAFNELGDKRLPDLTVDGAALAKKWSEDRLKIRAALIALSAGHLGLADNFITAEDEYNKLLAYVQGGEWTKGSLQDITKRIEKITGKTILYENQPSQYSPDTDLQLFKAVDSGIRAGEAGAKEAANKAGDIAASKWTWIIGGTIAATVGGMYYLQKKLH